MPIAPHLRYGARWPALAALALSGCPLDDRSMSDTAMLCGAGTTGASGADAGDGGDVGSSTAGMAAAGESSSGGREPSADAGAAGDAGTTSSGGGGTSGSGGSAGGASGGGSGGASGGSSGGGVAGAAGGIGGASACADVDENGVDDCVETLLDNPSFDSDASGWEPELELAQQRDARSAAGAVRPGSLLLANLNLVDTDRPGSTMLGSRQCVNVKSRTNYALGALIFVPDAQGDGTASFNVWAYSEPDCAGTFLRAETSGSVSEKGRWLPARGHLETSAATRSLLVRLAVEKPFRAQRFEALFDNLLLKEE